jgi:hypothetical protein
MITMGLARTSDDFLKQTECYTTKIGIFKSKLYDLCSAANHCLYLEKVPVGKVPIAVFRIRIQSGQWISGFGIRIRIQEGKNDP